MNLHLPPSCLPLHSRFFARVISGLSPTCPHLSPHTGWSECFGPDLSPTSLPYTLHSLPAWFLACLPLVSTSLLLVFRTCLPSGSCHTRFSARTLPAWFQTCLSPTSLPVHSGRCCPHAFTLVSHRCLPLHSEFSARVISHRSPTYLPVRSAPLRMILHLLPTCLQCPPFSWVVLHCLRCRHHQPP